MRPLRFLLSLATCVVAFFLLLFMGPWRATTSEHVQIKESHRATVGTYFNWHSPSSLFPPSAIISLTDDNSSIFLARPAAFGPLLPPKSLSGQLWIGSGFGEDSLGRVGSTAGAEGELGCSDVPGWDEGDYASAKGNKRLLDDQRPFDDGPTNGGISKRSVMTDVDEMEDIEVDQSPNEEDGTDDHLHHPLPASNGFNAQGTSAARPKRPTHADIQSLQESAEIAGKIVLLSRGGCGFLEKAKWVQRRGGVALIVGDDVRGNPLVTMYARGDTSNITIPSLFTSYTTAHLLSSLIPSGAALEDLDEAARQGYASGDQIDRGKSVTQKNAAAVEDEKPSFTTTTATAGFAGKATPIPHAKANERINTKNSAVTKSDHGATQRPSGWWQSLIGGHSTGNRAHEDSRRPPSSGNIGWVLQEEFDDVDVGNNAVGKQGTTSTTSSTAPTSTPHRGPSDGFVIGVQDWRDPDLVAEQKERLSLQSSTSSSSSSVANAKSSQSANPLQGGSITPGSGEYSESNGHSANDANPAKAKSYPKSHQDTTNLPQADQDTAANRGWFDRILYSPNVGGADVDVHSREGSAAVSSEYESHHKLNGNFNHEVSGHSSQNPSHRGDQGRLSPLAPPSTPSSGAPRKGGADHHNTLSQDGLWVTLTPASMSSSPFFDTLLVLVVSPLVTLTVVYALLLLRSRIRRRRWRAPKSLVERLPVRTYHTMPNSNTMTTSNAASTAASSVNAATPLLHSSSQPINTRPRPRARTASEIPHPSPRRSGGITSSPLEQIEEKRASGLAEWRRKYGGRQRECVVCLDEYVDGVSRVMSLPCGHEFHAECM